jgi:NarL family two-component system sensor histidine kinase YdfH
MLVSPGMVGCPGSPVTHVGKNDSTAHSHSDSPIRPGRNLSVWLLLQEEMNRFMARTAIACEIDIEGLTLTPEPYCEHILRFITEALTNIERHAHASHAWITARHRSDALSIEVRDDGVGFDPATIDPHRLEIGHYGLLGMRERARLAEGRLEVVSAPNKGTTPRLQLPLSKDTPHAGREKVWTNAFES